MPEPRSALAAVYRPGPLGAGEGPAPLILSERLNRTLLQISGWPDRFDGLRGRLEAALSCNIPADCRRAVSQGQRTVFRVGPERLWVAGPSDDSVLRSFDAAVLGEDGFLTEIGHSRTVLRVAGARARTLLNRGLPVDLDAAVFPVDAFAQSVIHHIPVLVHRTDPGVDAVFDLYVTCDYAVSFWEWLIGAARPLGGRVETAG